MTIKAISTVVLALTLTGCGVSASRYELGQQVLKGSPALQNDFIKNCAQRLRNKPLQERQTLAAFANTSVAALPRVFCSRVTKGVASGRLSYADVNAAKRGQPTVNMIKVLQGR